MNRRLLATLLAAGVLAACGADTPVRGPIRPADRGIGGTGAIADRGIGGTGIVGTVTAFGSIWVNGRQVALPPAASVRIEGRPAGVDAVRVGHVVAVAADPDPGGLDAAARTVEVRYAVAGPVEAAVDGMVTVLGQRVDLAGTRLEVQPRPGDWVAVSGLRRTDGAIAAGLIEPWEPGRGWLLRGTVGVGVPGTLALPGFSARLAAGVGMPDAGQPVRAAGRFDRGTPIATETAPDPLNPFGGTVGALSVETFVDPAGRPAGTAAALNIPLAAAGRIVVEGVVDAAGALHAGRSAAAPGIGNTAVRGLGGPPGPAGVGPGPGGPGPGPGPAPGSRGPGGPGGGAGRGSGGGRGR